MPSIQTIQLGNLPPGMIDLGIGQPAPALLPLAAMRQAAHHRLAGNDNTLLQYGAEPGDGYFRLVLADFLAKNYGLPVEPEQLFVTAGASQALDLICSFFARPGDTVFVEEPSYFLALRLFADRHLRPVSLPTDQDGLIIEALEEKLAEEQPAFLYTIPTFHNPSGVTLSAERRQRLVELSQQYNFLVVADEVYHLLNYTTEPPAPLASYSASGTVLSLGSFSKILAPGLRLGWIQANPTLFDRLSQSGLLDSGGGLNPFTSGLVRSALELGLQQTHLAFLKRTYQERAAFFSQTLRQQLAPAASFNEPSGGFFVWLRLPEGIEAERLLVRAREHKVGFRPGSRFSSQKGLDGYARLCFAYYEPAELAEGVSRLARVLDVQ